MLFPELGLQPPLPPPPKANDAILPKPKPQTHCIPKQPSLSVDPIRNKRKAPEIIVVEPTKNPQNESDKRPNISRGSVSSATSSAFMQATSSVSVNLNDPHAHRTGLTNIGNTCYINAVLHCVASSPLICAWLMQHMHSGFAEDRCCICHLGRDVRHLRTAQIRRMTVPSLVRSRHVWSEGQFVEFGQEDVSETYDRLTDVFVESEEHMQTSMRLKNILHGTLKSICVCNHCHHRSEQLNVYSSIHLAMQGTGNLSLEDLLRTYFQEEDVLERECDRCGLRCSAKKHLSIVKWPNLLCIVLKRFGWSSVDRTPFKLHNHIVYPPELPAHSETSRPCYVLRAVCYHIGSGLIGGHYTSHIRLDDNQWYFCNDSQAPSLVETLHVFREKNLEEGSAYLLFYERMNSADELTEIVVLEDVANASESVMDVVPSNAPDIVSLKKLDLEQPRTTEDETITENTVNKRLKITHHFNEDDKHSSPNDELVVPSGPPVIFGPQLPPNVRRRGLSSWFHMPDKTT